MQTNCFWSLGNGNKINIWNDFWIPNVKPPIAKPNIDTANLNFVSDLITNDKVWDTSQLERCFDNHTVSIIKSIPIPTSNVEDKVVWNLTSNKQFSVKSLYNKLNNSEVSSTDWSKIWKLKASPSIKMFMWKIANSILPTSMRVAAKVPNINTTCKLCNNFNESLSYLFLDCQFASQVRNHLNFQMDYVKNGTITCHDWIDSWFRDKKRDNSFIGWAELCSTINWHIWKARCNKVFENEDQNSWQTANTIVKYLNSSNYIQNVNYNINQSLYYNPLNDPDLKITPINCWHFPGYFRYRISIAISMLPENCDSAIGLTLIDDAGNCKEARGNSSGWNSRELLEQEGVEAAFQWAMELSGHDIEFQSDCGPTLKLLIDLYVKAREERFNNSNQFENQNLQLCNFKALSFNLVNRSDHFLEASISKMCDRNVINSKWTDDSLNSLIQEFCNNPDYNWILYFPSYTDGTRMLNPR